ncbi:CHAP domain-containing protein [Arcticibacter eurypsychrophilus]|uniref:CHAP domain-containing protein n=1 Tax=Arcticibacter eurypsychrophilus TaxID=1434752 RepID=UPI0009F6B018|nr:CHAP domain-containing protein [Arcticibacter eurypsychrophilus]
MKLLLIVMLLISLEGVYQREIGVREQSGNNDGAKVEEYLKYVGLKRGSPWCAAFVCWSLAQAGIENPRSGWSPDLFPGVKICWQRSSGVQLNSLKSLASVPCQGDVFGIFFPSKNRIAHVGFVDSWGEKYVITVEGNTNEAGSREGDGVYRKRRLIISIYRVAKWRADHE